MYESESLDFALLLLPAAPFPHFAILAGSLFIVVVAVIVVS